MICAPDPQATPRRAAKAHNLPNLCSRPTAPLHPKQLDLVCPRDLQIKQTQVQPLRHRLPCDHPTSIAPNRLPCDYLAAQALCYFDRTRPICNLLRNQTLYCTSGLVCVLDKCASNPSCLLLMTLKLLADTRKPSRTASLLRLPEDLMALPMIISPSLGTSPSWIGRGQHGRWHSCLVCLHLFPTVLLQP